MFQGDYRHSIDAKGRVIMPAKFRELLGNKFYITRGMDKNLQVYSCEEWENFYRKLSTLPMIDPNSRALKHHFIAGCVECEVDKQGRILIPQSLRMFADLDKDIAIVGGGEKVEIWNANIWDEYLDKIDLVSVTSNMFESGFVI